MNEMKESHRKRVQLCISDRTRQIFKDQGSAQRADFTLATAPLAAGVG